MKFHEAQDLSKRGYSWLVEGETYAVVFQTESPDIGIFCRLCRQISHNLNDISHLYCGNCHRFHERPANTPAPAAPQPVPEGKTS
jgi:hypothetical protein